MAKMGKHTTPDGVKFPHVTEHKGGSGWMAVIYHWQVEDFGGFPEPWDTGIGRYATQAEAAVEAKAIAEVESLPYYPLKPAKEPAHGHQ